MRKYVAYTPSENEYTRQADLAFIKRYACNGNIEKTYTGAKSFGLALNYTIRNGYTLIVAKLSHLGNSPKDITGIYNKLGSNQVVCCDCRVLSPDTIPLLVEHGRMLDEWQATFIKEVTRLNKKKGYKLGNPRWEEFLTHDAQKKGAEVNRMKALNHPANRAALPEIIRLREIGATYVQIATDLNDRGMRTTTGKKWTACGALRLWNRAGHQADIFK